MPTIMFGDDALRRLAAGVDVFADAVAVTLGPAGRSVAVGTASGAPVITTDGAAAGRALELGDPYAELGLRLVREAAVRTRAVAGDGSSTAAVLAQAMTRAGLRALAAGAAPRGVGRGVDRAIDAVLAHLGATARPVAGMAEATAVATRAARDQRLGGIAAEALGKVGTDGVIAVDESQGRDVEVEFTEGLSFAQGYLSPAMVTDAERGESVLHDAYVLVHDGLITEYGELVPLLDSVVATGRPLLVVAHDVQRAALAALLANHRRGVLVSAAVKAPALGHRRREHLGDLAVLTGARVVAPEAGLDLAHAGPDVLGRAYRVVVGRGTTTIIGGMGAESDIRERARRIEHELAAASTDHDRGVLHGRLAHLTGGACVVRVGATTEIERAERMRRIDDAAASARAAMRDGVVAGGGAALLHAVRAIRGGAPDGDGSDRDEQLGFDIVRTALGEPLRRIAANAGADGPVVAARVAGRADGTGYDAVTGRYRDMCTDGLVDPVSVVSAALRNAASIAVQLLTTAAAVIDPEPADPAEIQGHGHGHGHGH